MTPSLHPLLPRCFATAVAIVVAACLSAAPGALPAVAQDAAPSPAAASETGPEAYEMGKSTLADTVNVEVETESDELRMSKTYPNPAGESAFVQYALPSRTRVEIALYDALGRRIRVIRNEVQEGRQTVGIDVSDLPTGMYLVRLVAGDTLKARRLTVLR